MAPELDVLKRKRSRPSEYWVVPPTEASPLQQTQPPPKKPTKEVIQETPVTKNFGKVQTLTAPIERQKESGEVTKPIRRGRPSNTEAEVRGVAEQAGGSVGAQKKSKKLGRPTVAQEEDELVGDTTEAPIAPRKRGRPANTQIESLLDDTSSGKQQVRPKKHEQQPAASNHSARYQVRSNRQTRQSDAGIGEAAVARSSAKDAVGHINRSRRSNTVVEVEVAISSLSKERSGRKKRDNPSKVTNGKTDKGFSTSQESSTSARRQKPTSAGTSGRTSSQAHNKSSRRPSNKEAKRKRGQPEELNVEPSEKRRRIEREPQLDPGPGIEKPPSYQHLAAITRRVSRQTIEAKWEPLLPGCIERISQLLNDLQRPVIVRLNDDRKRTQASTALQMVSRRLISKISKGLPFPQGIGNYREDDFDFEKILDHNRALEAQLTPALHANELLEAELAKEKDLLEYENAALEELETNARTEATIRKQAGRKLHPLLLADESVGKEYDLKDRIGLEDNNNAFPFFVNEDRNLHEIVRELDGHVDSIRGNINQTNGIVATMARVKAAVAATLFEHMEMNQYEDVVLG